MKGLHVGCGARVEPGWENIDLAPSDPRVMNVDVRRGLPFPAGHFDLVYSEHFLEHLRRDEGTFFLSECARVLKPGGSVRISTPDMEALAQLYLEALKWRTPEKWTSGELNAMATKGHLSHPDPVRFFAPVGWIPPDPAELINGGMRLWEHKFIWDYDALSKTMLAVGFDLVGRAPWRRTRYDGMLLEGRPDLRDLIVEAQRPDVAHASGR